MLTINDTKYFSTVEVRHIIHFIRTQYAPYICLPYQDVIFRSVLGIKINSDKFYSADDIYKIVAFMNFTLHLEKLKSRYNDLREMTFEAVENYISTRETGTHRLTIEKFFSKIKR